MKYYMVGLKEEFVHVQDIIRDVIIDAMKQEDHQQLSYLLELKQEELTMAFYDYMQEWEHVHAFMHTFTYQPSNQVEAVEARITSYGMEISHINNSPMYRWFRYFYEYVLVLEIYE